MFHSSVVQIFFPPVSMLILDRSHKRVTEFENKGSPPDYFEEKKILYYLSFFVIYVLTTVSLRKCSMSSVETDGGRIL